MSYIPYTTASPNSVDKIFALVDCNSFYASCEKLFRPDLRHRPVIVLSNNDGCVVARSKEAKEIGIPIATPFFKIKPLIKRHRVSFFSSNYALYADISRRVMSILAHMAPDIEVYSIDEAFLDLSSISELHNIEDLQRYGHLIQERIDKWVGIQIGVGIAPSKTLAKLANHAAKKYPASGGVVVLLEPQRRERLLKITPIEDIWGIGRRLSQHLQNSGIKTAWELSRLAPKHARQQFSVILERIVRELNGDPCLELDDVQLKKQILSSRTFGRSITLLSEMEQAVSEYTTLAASKLRQQDLQSRHLSVFIQTNRYKHDERYYYNSASSYLQLPTNDTRTLTASALHLLKGIWRSGYHYNKAGVILNDLYSAQIYQPQLFDDNIQNMRDLYLMQTIDQLNLRQPDSIRFASQGLRKDTQWTMQRRYLSPAYTTRWKEIPRVQ
ncbi:MAG: translesion error-prone DNA polymerase V subunit UmuC [Alcaligenaceae bacterium]|nr:translesion error-prone DNA polymerase V subunit UmuC [Alcaligenaceae bacterium]